MCVCECVPEEREKADRQKKHGNAEKKTIRIGKEKKNSKTDNRTNMNHKFVVLLFNIDTHRITSLMELNAVNMVRYVLCYTKYHQKVGK